MSDQVLDLGIFQARLGVQFCKPELLRRALGFLEVPDPVTTSEFWALTWLGDAALAWVVVRHLYEVGRHWDRERLTLLRDRLVCNKTLARVARELRLDEYSRAACARPPKDRPTTVALATALEAILGAVVLDLGLEGVKKFVVRHLLPTVKTITPRPEALRAPEELKRLSRARFGTSPRYETVGVEEIYGIKVWKMRCRIKDLDLGIGQGPSPDEAVADAAAHALDALGEHDLARSFLS